jgi:hypothetical protein
MQWGVSPLCNAEIVIEGYWVMHMLTAHWHKQQGSHITILYHVPYWLLLDCRRNRPAQSVVRPRIYIDICIPCTVAVAIVTFPKRPQIAIRPVESVVHITLHPGCRG